MPAFHSLRSAFAVAVEELEHVEHPEGLASPRRVGEPRLHLGGVSRCHFFPLDCPIILSKLIEGTISYGVH